MTVKHTITAFAAAALVTLSAATGAFAAADSTDVTIQVTAPDNALFTAAIESGKFQDIKYRTGNGSQNSDGTLTVYANDTRGTGSGWTVTLKGSGAFTATDNNTIALDKFSLKTGSVQPVNGESVANITPQEIGSVSTNGQTLMVAQKKAGMGQFKETLNATVQVPDGTLIGSYKTTLTVAIVSGQ